MEWTMLLDAEMVKTRAKRKNRDKITLHNDFLAFCPLLYAVVIRSH